MIEKITVKGDGYVCCRSEFYTARDILNSTQMSFFIGVNKLFGEIDSGIWAVSYLLSMYKKGSKDFVLFDKPEITVNNDVVSLDDILKSSCYMDKSYPLFSSKKSVRTLVEQVIKETGMNETADSIRDTFLISNDRFERPVSHVGNEVFKAMAAIGYCRGKRVFCFPWMSNERFNYYHRNLDDLLDILERLKTVVIFPIGRENNEQI